MTTSLDKKLAHATTEQHVIAIYKLVKGVAELSLAAILIIGLALGWSSHLGDLAHTLRRHVTSAWSIEMADFLLRATTPHGFVLTSIALVGDGLFTTLEAWALRRRHWWGPWLVVVTTGALLPFEVLGFVHHRAWSRVVVFAINLLIVVLLARRVRIEQLERAKPTGIQPP